MTNRNVPVVGPRVSQALHGMELARMLGLSVPNYGDQTPNQTSAYVALSEAFRQVIRELR